MNADIDTALTRLPQWQPPADFAARLAAAAAREAAAAHPFEREPAWGVALEQLNRLVPVSLGAAALAAALVWLMPWSALAGGGQLVWVSAAVMSAAGFVLTLRVLRAP